MFPPINEDIALRMMLAGSKSNELRNLHALACKIGCKWEESGIEIGERGRTGLCAGSIGNR
jgi:hypothetical protein